MVTVSANDPVESFFNSLQIVKDSFLPLECGIRKAAKDFEHCWPGSNNGARNLELVSVEKISSKVQTCFSKKKFTQCVVSHDRGFLLKIPIKNFLGFFSQNCTSNGHEVNMSKKGLNERYAGNEDGTRMNCIRFVVMWSVLLDGFVQAFPSLFKTSKKHLQETAFGNEVCTNSSSHASKRRATCELKQNQSRGLVSTFQNEFLRRKEGMNMSIECLTGFVSDQLTQNLQKFDLGVQQSECKNCDSSLPPHPTNQFNRAVTSILEGKKEDINGFLRNLRFARVGGIPSSNAGVACSVKEEGDDSVASRDTEESGGSSPQKLANGLFSIPLSNVERLRSTLLTVSFTELIELIPQFGQSSKDYPDKKKLFSVQDFFRYTESAGRRFFEELDRDGDGQVTLEDLEVAMRKRKLPRRYAHEFMCHARSHLFSKSFGWKQFLSLMEQKEPTILRAYTTLCLSKSGTLQKSEILESLKNAGLPANEDNAVAMMRFLNADTEESISYGHFRDFMLLLPSDRLEKDPRSIWFKAATVVAVAPPVEIPAGSVLKSALAGGISCALSTTLMHPIDTIKTQVQASTLTFPEIISKLPEIGVRGLYRGSIPAILGQFSSHGLRTGICEASKLVLINVAPTLPDIQVQSVASFCSTFLGTAARIPCEVLKQRLQAGIFDNVGDAIVGTWHQDGLKGFFRGTGITLCREIPFYVAGTGLYAESKKFVQRLLRRDLEPWETIAVGALSGGLTAVLTTPFDVVKTRMMTATPGGSVSVPIVAFSILQHEGPLGLFKGAVPRFFWVAPLGAMNFAGYELLRKAMDKNEEQSSEQLSQKS